MCIRPKNNCNNKRKKNLTIELNHLKITYNDKEEIIIINGIIYRKYLNPSLIPG